MVHNHKRQVQLFERLLYSLTAAVAMFIVGQNIQFKKKLKTSKVQFRFFLFLLCSLINKAYIQILIEIHQFYLGTLKNWPVYDTQTYNSCYKINKTVAFQSNILLFIPSQSNACSFVWWNTWKGEGCMGRDGMFFTCFWVVLLFSVFVQKNFSKLF